MIFLHIGDRRVLQVFLAAERSLLSVGVVGEECREHRVPHPVGIARQRHVLLLVYGLELRVEAPYHAVTEPVGLYAGPVVYLVGGDVLGIDGLVVRGPGVRALGAYYRHKLVVLVGYRELGGLVAHGVYPMVDRHPLILVVRRAVPLEKGLYLVEHGLLGRIVGSSEALGALEHQVFEVVRESGGLGGVVLAADLDRDIGLDARSLPVHGHIEPESVVESVYFSLERISAHRLILLSAAGKQRQHRDRHGRQGEILDSFHCDTD